jgi:hypothetical protein
MSILLAKTAQEEISGRQPPGPLTLVHLVSLLEQLDPKNPESSANVHRVRDAEEEIYVLREGGIRVFFTRRENDIVVLSIVNG